MCGDRKLHVWWAMKKIYFELVKGFIKERNHKNYRVRTVALFYRHRKALKILSAGTKEQREF